MGDNFQSTQFPPGDFATCEKHAIGIPRKGYKWRLLRILKILNTKHDSGVSIRAPGSERATLHNICSNLKCTHFQPKEVKKHETHTTRSEGGANLAPVKSFKYP